MKTAYADWLLRHHDTWSRFVPSFYFPYRVAGSRIYLDIAESPMMFARVIGQYEPERHAAFEHFLRPKDWFIDVGVNKGDFTLLAAKLVGAEERVLAFEPEPGNCHWVNKSIRRNSYSNVVLFEMALSNENGTADLHLGRKSGWHTLIPGQKERAEGSITVQTRSLDNILEEQASESPIRMIKIDVEGAEMLVLRGAENTLRAHDNLVLLLDLHPHLGADNEETCAFLEDCGFQLYQEKPPFDTLVTERAGLRQLVAKKRN